MRNWKHIWSALVEGRAVFNQRWLDLYRVAPAHPGERPTDYECGVRFEDIAADAVARGFGQVNQPLDKEQARGLIEQLADCQPSEPDDEPKASAEDCGYEDVAFKVAAPPPDVKGDTQNDEAGQPVAVDDTVTPSANAPENPTVPSRMKLKLDALVLDGGTQHRVSLNEDAVEHMIEKMEEGDQFPAITVFRVAGRYFLADGFTRTEAHRRMKLEEIEADVIEGSERDARIFSYGANDKHGQHRTRADKRRVVENMLNDPALKDAGVRELARIGRVSRPLIDSILAERARAAEVLQVTEQEVVGQATARNTLRQTSDGSQAGGGSSATLVGKAASPIARNGGGNDSPHRFHLAEDGGSATFIDEAAAVPAQHTAPGHGVRVAGGGSSATPDRAGSIQPRQDQHAEAAATVISVSQSPWEDGQSQFASVTGGEASRGPGAEDVISQGGQSPDRILSSEHVPSTRQDRLHSPSSLNVYPEASHNSSVQRGEPVALVERDDLHKEVDQLQHQLKEADRVIAKFHDWARSNFLLLTVEMIELETSFDDNVPLSALQAFFSAVRDRAIEGEALSAWAMQQR